MNIIKIRTLCEKRAGGIRGLAKEIGMTEANLHRRINANDMKCSDLEKIAAALGVSIVVFFDESQAKLETHGALSPIQTGGGSQSVTVGADSSAAAGQASPDVLAEKVRSLSALVAEKDERISELKETIADLRAR